MSGWPTAKLEDIADVIDSMHQTPQYSDAGYPMVRVTDIKRSGLNLSGTLKVSEEVFDRFSKNHIPKIGDIVFSRVGSYGNTSIVKTNEKFCLGQNTAFIVPKQDPYFLFYFLNSPAGEAEIESSVAGSTQPTVSLKSIRNFDVPVPPIEEQKSIASILSSLDDKIDLLHHQNKTLEAMAETLFRQWFVEGAGDWEEKSLLDAIELVGGGTPKTTETAYWDGDVPWLSGGDIASAHKGFITESEKKISMLGVENSSAKLLPMFSSVITARGTVGKYAMLAEPMTYSQSNYGILPKFENCYFFTYLLINNIVSELHSAAYGSVFDTITTATFRDITVSIPDKTEIEKFESGVSSLFYKKLESQRQIKVLEKLRDGLLPKLMSGEARVV